MLLVDDTSPVADPLAGLSYGASIATVAEFGRMDAYLRAAGGWVPVVAASMGAAALTTGSLVVHMVPAQVVCALLAVVVGAVAVSLWTTRLWERPVRDRLRSLTAYDPNRPTIQVTVAQADVSRACRSLRGARMNMVFWRRSPAPADDAGLDAVMMIATPLAFPEADFATLGEQTRALFAREGIRARF